MAGSRSVVSGLRAAQNYAQSSAGRAQPHPSYVSPLLGQYAQWTMGRQSQFNSLPRDPLDFLTGAFGPLEPIKPIGVDQPKPGEDRPEPRRWQYPVAWNMPVGVPGSEGLKLADFGTLRLYSEIYSVARACIQLRKDEILGVSWDIGPTHDASKAMRGDREARKDFGERRAEVLRFFRKPDPNYNDFTSWLEAVLEDVLVVDALSVYLHPSRVPGKGVLGSNLAALDLIAGDTIRPLLDLRGGSPLPPNPAYQQYLYGVPRTDLMSILLGDDIKDMDAPAHTYRGDQLLYLPRNPRSWTPYGQCYDDQTEILTTVGWKPISQLDMTEDVATRDPAGNFEWQHPTAYVAKPYDGQLLHFSSQVHDIIVTPEHNMLVHRRPKPDRNIDLTPELKPASWFAEADGRGVNWQVPMTSAWKGQTAEDIVVLAPQPGLGKHDRGQELNISPANWARFIGWFLSEGSTASNQRNQIAIAQSTQSRYCAEIEDVLTAVGVKWYRSGADYLFSHETLAELLRRECYTSEHSNRSWAKQVPRYMKEWPSELLMILLEALVKGDGSFSPSGARNLTTTSRQLADDFVELLQKAGSQGSWAFTESKNPKHHDWYRVRERPTAAGRTPIPTAVEYAGIVYCVTVPNGTVYVRRNGKPSWCGNSPMERCIVPVITGLRRQQYAMDFFLEGSIPGMFMTVGDPDMTPNQLREYQDTLNALAGDQAWKHKIICAPAGSKFEPQKPPILSDQTDEVLMTQVLMAYSVMPMELGILPKVAATQTPSAAMQMAKASMDITERKTLKPDLLWLKNALFDKVIQGICGQLDMEWRWDGLEEDKDELTATQLLTEQISFGLTSIDEARIEIGRDPWGLEITQDPGWATAAGFLPLGAINPDTGLPFASEMGAEGAAPNGVPAIPGSPPGASRSGRAVPGEIPTGPLKRPASAGPQGPDPTPGARPQSPGHDAAASAESVAQGTRRPVPKAALSELDALVRHIRKGRLISTWEARNLPQSVLSRMSEELAKGWSLEQAGVNAVFQLEKVLSENGPLPPSPHQQPGPGLHPQGKPYTMTGTDRRARRSHDQGAPEDEDEGERADRARYDDATGSRGVPGTSFGPSYWEGVYGQGIDRQWLDGASGSPGPGGAGNPGGHWPPGVVKAGSNSAQKIATQLAEDYPQKSLGWITDGSIEWSGPMEISLDAIDFSHDNTWNASHEHERVRRFKEKLRRKEKQGGHLKPAVLIDRPDTERGTHLLVIDGHHRALASRQAGRPVWAWVGKTSKPKGPWLEFHAFQRKQGEGTSDYAAA